MARLEKLSIIVFSGSFDHVHYALATASAAAATNIAVTLFFTMGAIRALTNDDNGKSRWGELVHSESTDDGTTCDSIHKTSGVAGFEELVQPLEGIGHGAVIPAVIHRGRDELEVAPFGDLFQLGPEVRRLLQVIGTEAGRDIHGIDVWVDMTFDAIQKLGPDQPVVLTDIRFANEAQRLRSHGGHLVRRV